MRYLFNNIFQYIMTEVYLVGNELEVFIYVFKLDIFLYLIINMRRHMRREIKIKFSFLNIL